MAPPSSVPTVPTGVHGRWHPAGTCAPRPLTDEQRALPPGPGLPWARAGAAVVRG
ncbi:hypothetical protein JOD57_004773 [Geodermatophilus bullaregiensis]|uniref:hypothetical protein n=1 Tax=Geodermatophilus bullaregiensis TaxID=1564160 RepID=UPI00195AB4EE|nr:hypothetical protein [Geodermatophilus bullaregiensis]MBM7808936.1 hypothetical protein [Geodermatophilus bullaregiensis]